MSAPVSSTKNSADFVFAVVAVGSSAGGLKSLSDLIEVLPSEFRCPIVAVQHLSPEHKSLMAEILSRNSAMQIQEAIDGEKLNPGVVYLSPPAVHLLVQDGHLALTNASPRNHQRPSINMLFDSVAAVYGRRAIAIVLSGSGSDGADGIAKIKAAGGFTIAEDPSTAKFNGMPKAAINTGCVDEIIASQQIGKLLLQLSQLRRSVDQIVHG